MKRTALVQSVGFRALASFAALLASCAMSSNIASGQSANSTLQSANCASGVAGFLTSPGTINIYDGLTSPATPVASINVTSPLTFSWPIPAGMNDSKFHIISVSVAGGSELQNSPQAFSCKGAPPLFTYPVSISGFTAVPTNGWTTNGSLATSTGNLLYANGSGSLIFSNPIVPWDTAQSSRYEYEINTGITLNPTSPGGSYIHYIYGSLNAEQTSSGQTPAGTGTYHAVELSNPTFDDVGNCTAVLISWEKTSATAPPSVQGSASVPCGPTVVMRTVVFTDVGAGTLKVWTFLDNILYSFGTTAAPGQPGIGMIGNTSLSGFSSVGIAPRSIWAPAPIGPALPANQNPTTVNTSVFPNQVNLHWQQPQDVTGVGVAQRILTRSLSGGGGYETGWAPLSSDFSDSSAQPGQNYIYAESDRSFHGIWSPQTNIYVTTPPSGAVDPRRTGVRATGSYWGGMGESIDTLSGNLNFTLPLVKAMGRNGWAVPIGLAYNSQNWRQDTQTDVVPPDNVTV